MTVRQRYIPWCCVIILLVGCGGGMERSRIIKIGIDHGPTHSFTIAMQRFGESFEQVTNGRYQVKVYDSARLGNERTMQEMLAIGTLEMTITGIVNTYEPLFAVFELPYLYKDREHVLRVNSGPVLQNVAASLAPKGLRLVGFVENGFRNITNSVRPIRRPSDVAGLMIRTPENPAQIETFRALGAIPTPLSFSELYTALLQGVVDGQENPLQNIWHGKLYETQQYLAMTRHIYNAAYVLVSEDFWNTLPSGDQKTLKSCMDTACRRQLEDMSNMDHDLEQQLQAAGMEFTYPDRAAFAEACRPAWRALCDKLGAEAWEIVEQIQALKE